MLGAAMGSASDVVVDLNTAYVLEGAVIRVASGTRATETFYLGIHSAGNSFSANNPRYIAPRVYCGGGQR